MLQEEEESANCLIKLFEMDALVLIVFLEPGTIKVCLYQCGFLIPSWHDTQQNILFVWTRSWSK